MTEEGRSEKQPSSQLAALAPALIVLLAALGIGVSGYLTVQHWKLAAGSGERSICAISEELNCDVVNSSAYAEILGVPIALLGSVFYAGVAVLALGILLLPVLPARDLLAYVTLGSGGAVLYSAFLAGVSHFVIGSWCLFCLSLYGINLLLFCVSVWGGVGPREAAGRIRGHFAALRRRKGLALALAVLGVAVVSGLVVNDARRRDTADARISGYFEEFQKISPMHVPLTGNEPSKGPADAAITIVEYFDFQCGHCKKMARHLDELVVARAGEVRLVMKHMPLGQPCNRFMEGENNNMHPQTCLATAAALCADEQDRYWEMHDALFFYQQQVTEERLQSIVSDLELDRTSFESCLGAERTQKHIDEEVTEALVRLRLNGTPSLFVNGRYASDGFAQPGDALGFLDRVVDWLLDGAPPPDGEPAAKD